MMHGYCDPGFERFGGYGPFSHGMVAPFMGLLFLVALGLVIWFVVAGRHHDARTTGATYGVPAVGATPTQAPFAVSQDPAEQIARERSPAGKSTPANWE